MSWATGTVWFGIGREHRGRIRGHRDATPGARSWALGAAGRPPPPNAEGHDLRVPRYEVTGVEDAAVYLVQVAERRPTRTTSAQVEADRGRIDVLVS